MHNKTINDFALLFLIFLSSYGLTGCMDTAVSGAQAVYNHRSIENTVNDQSISYTAERKIYLDSERFQNTNVTVTCFNNIVLITGQVPETAQRTEIEQIVKKIAGDRELHNLIAIAEPTSPMTKISDSWITTKVKSKLITMRDVDPSQVKVITENGTVYLMGVVPPNQAETAIDIARNTDGVQSVVKVFSYIHISKTQTT